LSGSRSQICPGPPVKTFIGTLQSNSYVVSAAARAHDASTLLSSLKPLLRARVRDGHPTLEDAARALCISGRTLQRRLAEHGTRYQEVLDDTLRKLAEGYLRQPEVTLAEVAWLLGYVEQASFFRAFRRGHDMTPVQFRQAG
jgi:AraC-like DNA-binding protein